jgi:hypothetical protein
MDFFVSEYAQEYNISYAIDCYKNLITSDDLRFINIIIAYKKYICDEIYKQDVLKLKAVYCGKKEESYETFIKKSSKLIKKYKLENNISMKEIAKIRFIKYKHYCTLIYYYMSTFLDHKPTDIKIALKD